MQVIGDYARKIRVPTPMFNATKGVYIKAMKSGLGAQGYRRGLRRAGEDGQGQAAQDASVLRLISRIVVMPGLVPGIHVFASLRT